MHPKPATIGNELGIKLESLVVSGRILGAKNFVLLRLRHDVEKLKSVNEREYWYHRSLVHLLQGDISEFVRTARLAASLYSTPEFGLHYFPLFVFIGRTDLAYDYVGDWLFEMPISDYGSAANHLHYMLDARRLGRLAEFMQKIGRTDEVPAVLGLQENAMALLKCVPDAPDLVPVVSRLAAEAALSKGILFSSRPGYRYDLEEDCLYFRYDIKAEPSEAMSIEDEFWARADAQSLLQDGRVHVVFCATDGEAE